MKYKYIFTARSDIFHSGHCPAASRIRQFSGSHYYQTCLLTGRRPCKLCNPVEGESFALEEALPPDELDRTRAESRAIKRHRQAMVDRTALENNLHLQSDSKEDLYTLSTPRYLFFASKGYKTFHLRNCKNITNLQNLEGFPTYESACRAGYKPCRYCKPTDKHNIALSLPIYTAERNNESVEELLYFCSKNGFLFTLDRKFVYVETRAGIWRMNTSKSPYSLEHFNPARSLNNQVAFHQQSRLFLSMLDAMYYIKRHDEVLKFIWDETKYVPI